MSGKRTSRTAVVGVTLAAVLGASAGAFVANVLPTERGMPGRAVEAWTDRLEGQAEAVRQERANDAWTLRLQGQAMERVWDAWTARLNAQADAENLRGMSERAKQAWTDRLNAQADAYFANQ